MVSAEHAKRGPDCGHIMAVSGSYSSSTLIAEGCILVDDCPTDSCTSHGDSFCGCMATLAQDRTTEVPAVFCCAPSIGVTTPSGNQTATTTSISTPSTIASATGDPHIMTVTGEAFELYRLGWSTFVSVPRVVTNDTAELLVRGNVKQYWGSDPCAPAFIEEATVTGSWIGDNSVFLRAGSLESSQPFSVSVNNGPLMTIADPSGTNFLSLGGMQVTGQVVAREPELWGPDAEVNVQIGTMGLRIQQHTEGRLDSSRSMLDIMVSGYGGFESDMGGWIGLDGSIDAGAPPEGCPVHAATKNFRSLRRATSTSDREDSVGTHMGRQTGQSTQFAKEELKTDNFVDVQWCSR